MSETKTAKRQALELFDMIENLPIAHGDAGKPRHFAITKLNVLTGRKIGYTAVQSKKRPDYYHLVTPDGVISRGYARGEHTAMYGVPNWYEDVSACLNLPLPEGCMWTLRTGKDFASEAHIWSTKEHAENSQAFKMLAYEAEDALSVAMHRAWWSIQAD